ncbi:DUF211 domain-containing protein [Halapricum salinum]|uniref:DUF211 domain-containing protein n=1 Tax=Halapricum salinum TaxID=1457250 RepID=A0A4D6HH77_9EURY|nr:DUF211 domain-containing protein [Halapricum salinum]QCC52372.1 hypothetical protein DV733_14530 [Halapricum salinum]
MAPIRRLVLDVLKPHEPSLTDLGRRIADVDGVRGCNCGLVEIDKKVINVKLTVEGDGIDEDGVVEVIESHGGTIHSVDEVATGEELIEASQTPQD